MRTASPLVLVAIGIACTGPDLNAQIVKPEGLQQIQALPLKVEGLPLRVTRVKGNRTVQYLAGGVYAYQGPRDKPTLSLHCRNAVIWTASDTHRVGKRRRRLRHVTIYAEGDVRLSRPPHLISGERLVFDLTENRGYVTRARIEIPYRGETGTFPLYLRAEEFRVLNRYRSKATGAELTSCSFADPHYHFAASEVVLMRSPKGGGQGREFEASEVVPKIGDVPLFYLPYVAAQDVSNFYLKTLRAGKSKRFGRFVYSTFGGRLPEWQWTADLDFRSARGPAAGFGFFWNGTDPVTGYPFWTLFRSYVMKDRGSDRDGTRPGDEERYRFFLLHRHLLPYRWRMDLEYSRISDSTFLEEYFQSISREEKEQEAVIFLRRTHHNQFYGLTGKIRVNSFESTVEQIPDLDFSLVGQSLFPGTPILRRLTFDSQNRLSQFKQRFSQNDDSPSNRTLRADSLNRLSVPFQFESFALAPFMEGRMTQYERTERGSRLRLVGATGATLSTTMSRVFAAENEFFDIHKLRHVVRPSVSYLNIFETNINSSDLTRYDDVDSVEPATLVVFSLTTALQTRRRPDPVYEPVRALSLEERYEQVLSDPKTWPAEDVVFLDVSLPLFPRQARDGKESLLGLMSLDMTLSPYRGIALGVAAKYDFEEDRLRNITTSVSWTPESELTLTAAHHFARDVQSLLVLGTTFRYSRRYSLHVQVETDLERRQGTNESYRVILRRQFHRVALDIAFIHDPRKDDEKTLTIGLSWTDINRAITRSVTLGDRPLLEQIR